MAKRFAEFSWGSLLLVASLASFLNLIPILSSIPYGDVIQNYMFIHCYSDQLWSGDFYPRWCMDANLGLGTPGPIFYFPLPFMLASIFYPLHHLGVGIIARYELALWLVNAVTFITCTLWLKRYTSFRAAMFCSFILLWLPYHMAVGYLRASYAELWCMALMPLLFMQVEDLGKERLAKTWPKLSITIALCMLCHAPVTFIALMACGIIILIHHRAKPSFLMLLAGCSVLALCATLFHWYAAMSLGGSLNEKLGGVAHWRTSWLNGYVNALANISGRGLDLILAGLSILITFALAAIFLRKKESLDVQTKRLALSWIAIAGFSFVMLFSISAPLWNLIEHFTQVKTPWRMQVNIAFATIILLALATRHIPLIANRKPGDAVLAVFMVMVLGAPYTGGADPKSRDVVERMIDAEIMFGYFNTAWLDAKYGDDEKGTNIYYKRFADEKERVHLTGGRAEITQWGYDGINVTADAKKPGKLIVNQFYFPTWHATLDGEKAELKPEKQFGRIELIVPPGKHEVVIFNDTAAALPATFKWIKLLSLVAWVVMIGAWYAGTKCFDKPLSRR